MSAKFFISLITAAIILVGAGCYRFYVKLEPLSWGMSRRAGLWIATMVPAGLFVIFGLLIFFLVNKPNIADFMISAEGELKKVSWSNRKEVAVSTFIVIVVLAFMAILLWLADLLLQMGFMNLLGY